MQLVSQICAIALIMSLIYFHYCHPHINTEINVIFGKMLVFLNIITISELAVNVLSLQPTSYDFVSSICIMIHNAVFVLFLCYLFNYICRSAGDTSLYIPYLVRYGLGFLSVVFTFEKIGGIDVSGPYLMILCGIIILTSMCVLFKHIHSLPSSKVQCLLLWFVLYIVSIVIQSLFNVDFSSFVCALSLFFLFYSSENPEGKIDKTSGFFMAYYIQDYFLSKSGHDLSVGIIHSRNTIIDTQTIVNLVSKYDVACFIDTNNFCYLVSFDTMSLHKILLEYNSVYTSVLMLSEHVTAESISSILSYAKRQSDKFSESFVYSIHQSDIQKLDKDDKMHLEIINALVENRIETYVQPIYDIATESFVSGECLCRLKRRNGDLVPPGEFISVAERTGLIVDIETSMFRNMCACLSDERIKTSTIKYLEANLSIKKGEQRDLFEEYTTIVKEYGVDSDKVNLEITETDSVDKKMLILNNMKMMRELGFNFSLDDFGTGESNLGYIIDMPVSIIKFDREITQKAMVDEKALTIVKNVIQMVHDLDIKVVVEGVETERDFNMCKSLHADYIQGYYFSKPLPMEDFITFVVNACQTQMG